MGQIANQMALKLFFKIKERIKEKRSKNKTIKTMVQRNRRLPVLWVGLYWGIYFCGLLWSLPKVYPRPKQVKPKLTTAIKSILHMAYPLLKGQPPTITVALMFPL